MNSYKPVILRYIFRAVFQAYRFPTVSLGIEASAAVEKFTEEFDSGMVVSEYMFNLNFGLLSMASVDMGGREDPLK